MKKITKKEVEIWLGTSNPEEEAISTIVDIVNGEYSPVIARNDIIQTIKNLRP